MSWKKVKLSSVLKQYRIEHQVQDNIVYKQVTISKYDGVSFRGVKLGTNIGRKRQFIIDLDQYPNTLMFVRQGVQNGSIGIAPKSVDKCIVTENMPMFLIHDIEVDYLELIIKSPYFVQELSKIATTGSAQKSIHERQILEIEIPFPAKSDQLLFIETVKKIKFKSFEITSELSTQLSLLKQLRQSFLREAMQGKLCQTDPLNDSEENGQQLLERIKAEKAQLIKEKKLKKEKELPAIKPEEIPFEIPENWVWCRLGDLAQSANNGLYKQESFYQPSGIISLRMFNIQDGEINFSKTKRVVLNEKELNTFKLEENDILVNRVNSIDLVGKSAIVRNVGEPMVFESMNIRLTLFYKELLSEFINLILLDQRARSYFYSCAKVANGQVSINQCHLFSFLIPLPPISQLKFITNKIKQLMQTCDQLEASIKQSQVRNEQLLQQVLKEALEVKESALAG